MLKSASFFQKVHPLFYVTICLILGIGWHNLMRPLNIPTIYYYIIAISMINILITAYFIKKQWLMIPALCIATFSTGSLLSHYQYAKHRIYQQTLSKKSFDAQGVVKNITLQPHLKTPCRITFNILKIRQKDWLSINTDIYIYTQFDPNIKEGDTICVKNIVCNKITSQSFENYLIKENVSGTIFSNKLNFELIHRPLFSLNQLLNNKKEKVLNAIQNKLSDQTFPLFSSLFLGNKTQCKKKLESTTDQFKTWGISHYLARSGLHLIVFVLLWEFILCIIPLAFWIKQLIMLMLSLLYFLLSWPSLSFMRALYTFVLYKSCILFKKQTNFIHLLSIVCLFTLLLNPIQLLFLDFQLSFGLTFALAYFNHNYRTSTT